MIPWKRYVSPTVGALIALTVAMSLIAAVDSRGGGRLYAWLALVPARVWHGEVWRLVTWSLVEAGPLALVFACISLYWFGGDLASSWGQRRLLHFVLAIVLIAGVGTSLFALILPRAWRYPHLGSWALGDALVIAWALQFPERTIRLHQVIVLGGTDLAYGTFGFTVLCVIYYGMGPFLPALLAGGAALLYMTRPFRPTWLRLRRFFLERRLRNHRGGRSVPFN